MPAYEILDHPADVRLRIFGATPETLFENAARGFNDLVTNAVSLAEEFRGLSGAEQTEVHLKLEENGLGPLLLAWLRELLFLFETRRQLFFDCHFQILNADRLEARLKGILFDPPRHEQKWEVKAVTWHGFKLEETAQGWTAEVLFDI